jgi:hypothetical protein
MALLLVAAPARAADVWVFAKDGSVGLGDPARESLTLALADGSTKTLAKDDIAFQRTREQVDRGVAAMVLDISRGQKMEEHSKRFVVLKAAAVPKLLEFLKDGASTAGQVTSGAKAETMLRLAALLGLQHAWAPQAEEAVFRLLADPDFDIRSGAYQVLIKHVPVAKLAPRIQEMADAPDIKTAVLVFELVDKQFPDASLKRIRRVLRDPTHQTAAWPRLSHYLSPSLTEDTLPLLNTTDRNPRRGAVVGLIAQLAGGEAVRVKLRPLLNEPDADLREIAAEYFTWLGQRDDLTALREQLGRESDPHARAALLAAVTMIEARAAVWAARPALANELDALRQADPVEPTFIYEAGEHAQKEYFRKRALRLQELLVFPAVPRPEKHGSGKLPPADKWVAPVRDYFDPARKSFGFAVGKEYTAFSGSVHVGDDAAWNKDLRTVVAMAPGVVRSVEHVYTWGFIVIIEHAQPDGGRLCSVYAHLTPLLHVRRGDMVAAGQKIGSVGRSHTVENGGYGAHVHLGLHRGSYDGERWLCGYISPERWAEGKHGWVDLQAFIKGAALPGPSTLVPKP